MASDSWTTIESDPGVFSELISTMGVKGVEVAELWSCDRESLAALEPIYGLIFLFKWVKDDDPRPVEEDYEEKGVFFASQVIQNACATQAIISVLLNAAGRPGLELGPELTALRDFTVGMPPDVKGLSIGNSEAIRTAHNSFRAPQPLIPEEKEDDKDGEAFHFVAYLPAAGGLYLLDGLKQGPVRICDCNEAEWLDRAAAAVTERIARYSASEQRFNLMAVVRSRRDVCLERLQAVQVHKAALAAAPPAGMDCAAAAAAAAADAELGALSAELAAEEDKQRRWADENLRRRTDFTPFAFNLLKCLAQVGQLQPLVAKAKEAAAPAAK